MVINKCHNAILIMKLSHLRGSGLDSTLRSLPEGWEELHLGSDTAWIRPRRVFPGYMEGN